MVEWSSLKGTSFLKWLKTLDYKEMGSLNVNLVNEKIKNLTFITLNHSSVRFYVKVISRWHVCFHLEISKTCYILESDFVLKLAKF